MAITVHNDGVAISVSRAGWGRPLVLCPGLLTTQADLHELIELLRRDHEVVTFDLRGHGLSSAAAGRYTFEAFLGDLGAVMARLDLPSAPVLVGHSLGADLALHHARAHPDTVGALVLVDGANPVPEPFLSEADLPEFRAMADDAARHAPLTAREIIEVNLEVDAVRARILDVYREIDRPISMIMSTAMAGDGDDERTRWRNRNWRAGIERLVRERPDISTTWLDAGHGLVVTHPTDVARIISRLVGC
ncbi:alpha/beta fold hydrolase [Pseudonocardia acaciae]|uniref:alpha/beta fold hydrolase n=1 Tax=Pseudonocardia acaciae TaxID=551276 RepID=UPI00048D7929|nr:alpha/beta hydrolase [Pseudonocardia acaciae]